MRKLIEDIIQYQTGNILVDLFLHLRIVCNSYHNNGI